MSKNKIEVEGMMELSRVVGHLEKLLDGLKTGKIHVQAGQESATLIPPSIVDFEMEVARKKEKCKIALEITWKTESNIGDSIKISSHEPEIEIS